MGYRLEPQRPQRTRVHADLTVKNRMRLPVGVEPVATRDITCDPLNLGLLLQGLIMMNPDVRFICARYEDTIVIIDERSEKGIPPFGYHPEEE